MAIIRWNLFPNIEKHASAKQWLELQANRQLSPRTVEAYGRGLEDWLQFCQQQMPSIDPEMATRADLGRYVNDLAARPGPRGANVLQLEGGTGLSHQTIQLRITAARLYYDHLADMGIRTSNPVGRGKYTKRHLSQPNRQAGTSGRPLLRRRAPKLPWIPSDEEFGVLLHALQTQSARNQALLMLMYDGALRRDELVQVELADIDWSTREVTLRPEICKNSSGRLVLFTKPTSLRIKRYLDQRKAGGVTSKTIFVSESNRNKTAGISADMVNKVVKQVAEIAGLPRLHPHTFRHLRLTHMARCGIPEQVIAQYAGHRSVETTRIYIHLSGREMSVAVAEKMDAFDHWIESVLAAEASL